MSAKRWFVCDMDEGVLRIEPTRRAAVEWCRTHSGGKVIRRYAYGPGYYSYLIGYDREDHNGGLSIVREDCLRWYGLDTPPGEIKPLYPYVDEPLDFEARAD